MGKPEPRASTTDAGARVMKMPDGGFRPGYNVQLATAGSPMGGSRTVVGVRVTNVGSDLGSVTPMLDEIERRTGQLPKTLLADAGYFSEANIEATCEVGIDPLIATGRQKHGTKSTAVPRGRIPKGLTPKQLMTRKLSTKKGKAAYARRKAIVEPAFGQMKVAQDAGGCACEDSTTPKVNGPCKPSATTPANSATAASTRSPQCPSDSPPRGVSPTSTARGRGQVSATRPGGRMRPDREAQPGRHRPNRASARTPTRESDTDSGS